MRDEKPWEGVTNFILEVLIDCQNWKNSKNGADQAVISEPNTPEASCFLSARLLDMSHCYFALSHRFHFSSASAFPYFGASPVLPLIDFLHIVSDNVLRPR